MLWLLNLYVYIPIDVYILVLEFDQSNGVSMYVYTSAREDADGRQYFIFNRVACMTSWLFKSFFNHSVHQSLTVNLFIYFYELSH